MICPLHSLVWRKDLDWLLEKYSRWSSYEPEEKTVLIAYASVYGHTEQAADAIAARLAERGVPNIAVYDVSNTHPSYILADAFRCSALVFASITYNNGIFCNMETLLHQIAAHNLQNRTVAFLENGSWAPVSVKHMTDTFASLKNMKVLEESLTIRSSLKNFQGDCLSPVILGVSEGAGKYMTGFKTVSAMVKAMIEELNITVPVALHLDHGTYEGCYKCIDAGFSSIMFDGSHYPIAENVEKTKELVKVCAEKGISLEAEVGSIGGEEDGVIGMGECADPNECKAIADLGVDMLAAGIGNIHGKYPANWPGLSFETLAAVKEKVGDMPLVLHGGTGIPEDMIKKAISLGVAKINVNTECQLAFAEATRQYIEAGKDQQGKGFDPRKLLAPGFEAIKETVKTKMELFGSIGKA